METNLFDPAVSPYLRLGIWMTVALVGLLLLRKYLGNIIELFTNPYQTEEEFWNSLLTGVKPGVPMYFMRDLFTFFKCNRRCKVCNMPFDGICAAVMKILWSGQSSMTPDFCKKCEDFAKRHVGGAEIDMTLLFVDMRDSTGTGGRMNPKQYRDLLNRFYILATEILTNNGAWIDKFVGDEAIGLYVPGFAGKDHAYLAAKSARELLEATGHGSQEGSWVRLGIGINTGNVFMGAVGTDNVTDITALGDEVNRTSRLCSAAETGEIIFSKASYDAIAGGKEEHAALIGALNPASKSVVLKGFEQPEPIYVAKVAAQVH